MKRFTRWIMIFVVLAGIMPANVFAAGQANIAGESGNATIFSDVPEDAWYLEYLQAACASGIVGGIGDGCFAPDGNLTNAQILVMAANLHSRQKKDSHSFQLQMQEEEHWSKPFLDYCKAEGIVDDRFDAELDEATSRGEMAYVFSRVLTEYSYRKKKALSLNDIAGTSYEEEICKLMDADIVSGFPGFVYRSNDTVTRAQATVFVSNLLDCIEDRGRWWNYRYNQSGLYWLKDGQTYCLLERPILSTISYRAGAQSSGPVVLLYDPKTAVSTEDGTLLGTSIVEVRASDTIYDFTYLYNLGDAISENMPKTEYLWMADSREFGLLIHSIWSNDGSVYMRCLRNEALGGGIGIYSISGRGEVTCMGFDTIPDSADDNPIRSENERLEALNNESRLHNGLSE